MKALPIKITLLALIGLAIGCQSSQEDVQTATNYRKPDANARRACGNTISYGFIKPADNYEYSGGCANYFVNRGTTRQIKIRFSNLSAYGSPQVAKLRVGGVNSNTANALTYSVASTTGGSAYFIPDPTTPYTENLVWEFTNYSLAPSGNYELTLNVTARNVQSGAENHLWLLLDNPCTLANTQDCELDDELNLVFKN